MRDIKAGGAYVELLMRDRGFRRKLKNAGKQLKEFGTEMQAVGRTLAAASAALLVPLGVSAQTFADFDDRMRTVKAVTQATSAEFAAMTRHAKLLGATTSFTASEVALLKAELGRAGFDPTQIDRMTASVLDLAKATDTDGAQSAGIMAAALRQFSLGAGEAGRVADALTAAANGSFNTLESLGESLSYAGPVASDFNMSIEETLAILGALGNVGIQGSNAGTAVRRLLTLSGAEAKKLNRIFGVEFRDAAGNARPLVDVLSEVNEATKNLGTADRSAKFNEAFGLLGITGASAISKNVVSVKELQAAILGAEGVANATAAEMESGLGGTLRKMWSAIEGVSIALGQALAPTLTTLATQVAAASGVAIDWISANEGVIQTVFQVAAGVGAVGVGLIGLGGAITGAGTLLGFMATGASALAGAVGLLLTPLGLAAAAMGGLAAVVATSSQAMAAFRVMATTAWDGIASAASSAWAFIQETVAWAWEAISTTAGAALEWLRSTVVGVFADITFAIENWRGLLELSFVGAAAGIVTFAGQAAHFFTKVIPGYLQWFANNWRDYFTDVYSINKTIGQNIWKNLQSLWGAIKGLFSGDGFDFEWTPLTKGFESAIRELPEVAEREIGPLEQALKDRLAKLQDELGKKRKAKREEFEKLGGPDLGSTAQAPEKKPDQKAPIPGETKTPDLKGIVPSIGDAAKEVLVSFSAAALAGQTAAGSDPQLSELKAQTKLLGKVARQKCGGLGP